ncbi:MAG: SIMPL domain-containing protein [Leptothrix sp. (in: b-proteobacteria)]
MQPTPAHTRHGPNPDTPLPSVRRPRAARWTARWLLLGLVACGPAMAQAHEPAPAADSRVNLSATASTDVAMDTLTITLRVQREGGEAAAVQSQLKQVLEQALLDARRQAQGAGDAQALSVSTGAFQIGPRYGRDGKVNGWSGSADLTLQGRDSARVAGAAGRINAMVIVGSAYSVSTGLREQQQAELTAQAIDKFRARASEVAQRFGYAGYAIGEVSVQASDADAGVRPQLMAMRAMAAPIADTSPLPTEAGRATLGVTVQGSIRLQR